jgi:hypothetical protein
MNIIHILKFVQNIIRAWVHAYHWESSFAKKKTDENIVDLVGWYQYYFLGLDHQHTFTELKMKRRIGARMKLAKKRAIV